MPSDSSPAGAGGGPSVYILNSGSLLPCTNKYVREPFPEHVHAVLCACVQRDVSICLNWTPYMLASSLPTELYANQRCLVFKIHFF